MNNYHRMLKFYILLNLDIQKHSDYTIYQTFMQGIELKLYSDCRDIEVTISDELSDELSR